MYAYPRQIRARFDSFDGSDFAKPDPGANALTHFVPLNRSIFAGARRFFAVCHLAMDETGGFNAHVFRHCDERRRSWRIETQLWLSYMQICKISWLRRSVRRITFILWIYFFQILPRRSVKGINFSQNSYERYNFANISVKRKFANNFKINISDLNSHVYEFFLIYFATKKPEIFKIKILLKNRSRASINV